MKKILLSFIGASVLFFCSFASEAANDTITVTWTAVTQDTNNNPTVVTAYKIDVSYNGAAFVFNSQVSGSQTQQVFTSRAPGTYVYRVRAVSSGGESVNSALTDMVVISDPNTPPKAPTNVVATGS